MGIFVVIGTMVYSAGLFLLLERFGRRSRGIRSRESEWNCPAPSIVIPDRVPPEWVEAYRTERGG
jgi:hypothetical protein